MPISILLGYALTVGLLIFTRWTNKHKIGLICKSILGMLFILISFILLENKKVIHTVDLLVIYALLCNTIGDIFLGMCKVDTQNKNYHFYSAVAIIAISQIIYLIVSVKLVKFNVMSLMMTIVIVILFYALFNRIYNLTKQSKITLFYAFLLTLAMLNSVINILVNPNTKVLFFGIGMILYWISDFLLFIVKFGNNNKTLDSTNKLLYYLAQVIIAYFIMH